MSKYTTQVRFICETASGLVESAGFDRVDEIIAGAWEKVFNFDFPIFDEKYRGVLCQKILRQYYTEEICAETVGQWKLFLSARLNKIMPYYNQLYKSELLEFNPLYDIDYRRSGEKTSVGDKTDSGTTGTIVTVDGVQSVESDNTHWDYYHDTPQGGVDDLENLDYLTNARKITDSGNSETLTDNVTDTKGSNENKSEYNNVDEYLETVQGKQGGKSYAKMLIEYRQSFLNIDAMILDELQDLFFGLWNAGL